jgi:hypothetical protein
MGLKTQLFVRPIVENSNQNAKDFITVDEMLLPKGPILHVLCREHKLYDYAQGVSLVWTSSAHNLFIIEHDIIPSAEVITNLNECSYPMCVPLYRTNSAHTGLNEAVIPHRTFSQEDGWEWATPDTQWADMVGFGCVKMHIIARKEISGVVFSDKSWKQLDSFLSKHLAEKTSFRWHVHPIWVKHSQS